MILFWSISRRGFLGVAIGLSNRGFLLVERGKLGFHALLQRGGNWGCRILRGNIDLHLCRL